MAILFFLAQRDEHRLAVLDDGFAVLDQELGTWLVRVIDVDLTQTDALVADVGVVRRDWIPWPSRRLHPSEMANKHATVPRAD